MAHSAAAETEPHAVVAHRYNKALEASKSALKDRLKITIKNRDISISIHFGSIGG